MVLGVLGWFGISVVVGCVALSIGRSFFPYFLLSVLLSPVLGFIILAIKGKATKEEMLDNTPHVYFCNSCDSVFSGRQIQCSECPSCGKILIETSILRDDWRASSDEKKNELKRCFKRGQFLRESIHNLSISNSTDSFSEVKHYKELLEMGVITQEEFDQKKKQLLKL